MKEEKKKIATRTPRVKKTTKVVKKDTKVSTPEDVKVVKKTARKKNRE